MRILILEDDKKMKTMLKDALEQFYTIDTASSLDEGLEFIESFTYEAVLLDRDLDGSDEGMLLIPKLKKSQPACAIIIASAYGGVEERIAGLSAGADDYIEKPYDLRELKMRIDVLIKRHAPDLLELDGLHINIKHGLLTYEDVSLTLSKKEHDLLFFLASHPDKVFSRDDIANAIYSDPSATNSNTIDAIIKNIRKKLPINPIETMKGRGYALKNT
ncbi:MAG: response regulator transcription factor [Sulfurimonadaceae bacterium]|jgi:DNA-binding response OmpR family regulator|nr:response regulator transcription factor [Sulfurimonadaceae bacterium]